MNKIKVTILLPIFLVCFTNKSLLSMEAWSLDNESSKITEAIETSNNGQESRAKTLRTIAAKVYAKHITANLNEKNIDQQTAQLQKAYAHIGSDHAEHITNQMASCQPYPLFQELSQDTILVDVCLPLQQCITFNYKTMVFSVFDRHSNGNLISLDAREYDKVKFLNNTYLSCLQHTDSDCDKCIVYNFEDAQWKPLANIEAPDSIIDVSLSPDNTFLACALKNDTVLFLHQTDNNQWEQHPHEISLSDFADQLKADVYQGKPGRCYLSHPDRFFHFKKSDTLMQREECTAISSLTFLPTQNSSKPQLLLGLTPYCHKHPNEGILTLWHYDDNQWHLQQILRDKHDWPIISMQPSRDGSSFLTQSYSCRPLRSYTTCWQKDTEGIWHILKRTRQHSPTKIAPSLNCCEDSFISYANTMRPQGVSFFKQFSLDRHNNKKMRKLAIAQDEVSSTFPWNYEWKTNTRPILWLNNHEIAIADKVFQMTPSIEYLLCQHALKSMLVKKPTRRHLPETLSSPTTQSSQENRFYTRLHTFLHSKTFQSLPQEEQLCLVKHVTKSTKYSFKSRAKNQTFINAHTQERFTTLIEPYLRNSFYFEKTDKK